MTVAHGFDAARLARQIDEIDRLNAGLHGFTLLKGVEVDILEDGALDLPDSILSRLDLVVAAVHSHFDLSREAQTTRIVRAMDNPQVSIIAHPTGRLIGQRAPYDLDFAQIAAVAAERGCRLEINAAPDRLDLDDVHALAAKEAKALIAISTDAHAPAFLEWMRFGVEARRGWLKERCSQYTAAFEAEEIPSPLSARARIGAMIAADRSAVHHCAQSEEKVCLRTRP